MDRRTAKGLRSLNVWVTPELGAQLDKLRGDVPMQRFVVRALEKAVREAGMEVASFNYGTGLPRANTLEVKRIDGPPETLVLVRKGEEAL